MAWFHNESPTLYQRLTEEKKRLESETNSAGPRLTRNTHLEKIRQLDVAAQVNDWLSSSGLRVAT